MKSRKFWHNYWQTKTCGEHRSQEECFLAKEAKEKLFHLDGGNSLLDFACGSADLFAYYSRTYQTNVGVDFSEQMLERAKIRLERFDVQSDVLLINSDDTHLWQQLENNLGKGCKFDRITAGQVVQYLNEKQVEEFVSQSVNYLSEGGLICLFDIVDSRTFELWNAGLFQSQRFNLTVLFKLCLGRLRAMRNKLKQVPVFEIGYTYPPSFFEMLANKYQLNFSVAHSMYYEYRYHVILKLEKRRTFGVL
jgi:Cyclopropane fatty acid synthase and related methyltransferases